MKFLIPTLALVLSVFSMTAKADHACLREATNSDLLSELSRRLNDGGGSTDPKIVVKTDCESGRQLSIATFTTNYTAIDSITAWTSSNTECEDAIKRFPFNGHQFVAVKVPSAFAYCDGRQLIETAIKLDGKFEQISSKWMDNNAACLARMSVVNGRP